MKRSIFLCLALVSIFLWNCECEDLAPTVIEEFPDPFFVIDDDNVTNGFEDDGFLFFDITLNKLIDTSLIDIGQNILFEGLDTLRFEPFSSFGNTIFFNGEITDCTTDGSPCSGSVKITLKGIGNSVVQSTESQILDGDKDGSDGGDFIKTFEF
ncbi:MAG: hypothetical protein AAF806_05490 [Bacteroidota bacterium]